MLKMCVTKLLAHFGLLPHAERFKNLICAIKYASKKQFSVTVGECNVTFSTDDGYSKKLCNYSV